MAQEGAFARGHPVDIPIRQSHLVELDWMADQRNIVRTWVPENVVCVRQGIIVMVIREDVDPRWHRSEDGALCSVLNLPGRCRIEAALRSIRDGVDLTLTLTNLGEAAWQDTWAAVCTQFVAAPDFADFGRERTFIWRRGEQVLCGKGHFTEAAGPDGADPGFMAALSRSGRYVAATGWDRVKSVGGNDQDSISCIHSNPSFGDVASGEAVTRRGRIYMMPGTPEDALARYREDFT